ncbi:hypothetical protein, partial [Paraburkholderia fungorum]|uniref:hypothetical protein n=1 Tax=Paraburkholderia fungorum TaxID=134537 RepID=UPI00241F40B2
CGRNQFLYSRTEWWRSEVYDRLHKKHRVAFLPNGLLAWQSICNDSRFWRFLPLIGFFAGP